MVAWGLGIEHEFFLKFDKKKTINSHSYDVYINSGLIKNMSDMNEINFYQNYKSTIKNNKYYDDYNKYMDDLILLRNYAIKKQRYPFDKIDFFNIKENERYNDVKYYIDEKSINKMKIYLFYFILYHDPIIFFNLKFEKKDEISCNKFELLFLERSNDKELLVNKNYELFNNIYNKIDALNFKQKMDFYINSEKYDFYKIMNSTTLFFTKTKDGNNKNNKNTKSLSEKTFYELIHTHAKFIKDYVFNDIKIDKNIITDVFYCYKNNIPILDISSSNHILEMMTIEYKNLNFETIYKNFIKYENTFIKYTNILFNKYIDKNKYGDINYNKIGSRKESVELIDIFNEKNIDCSYRMLYDEDYTGSFHIWVTCPYDEKISKSKFLNIHANLANKLQLLEPVIACNFSSPSYDIKHNKNYPSKLSLRHFINSYSNYGTSDVSLINGSEYTNVNAIFFDKKNKPDIQKIYNQKKKVYNVNNTLIKSYNVLNDRKYTNNIFNFITKKKNNSKNVNVKSFYELLFKKNKLSFKEFQKIFKDGQEYNLGSDIRTRNNDELMYPLDKTLKKIFYPKNNKYIVHYIDTDGKIHDKRKYNTTEYKTFVNEERVGIEFRILDHFNTMFLDQILSLLPYLIMESYTTYPINTICDTHVSKQFWHNEMYEVIADGYKHNFTKKYIDRLNKEFNINLKNKNYTSDLVLEEVFNELKNKYGTRKYKTLLNKLTFSKSVKFISLNEYASKIIEKNT